MTKNRILLQAESLFYSKGYGSATMREIASAVGIEAASLYNHFKSKEEILAAVCLDLLQHMNSQVDEIVMTRRTSMARLETFIRFYLKYQVDHWEAFQIMHTEYKHLSDKNLELYKKLRNQFESRILIIIKKGIDENKFIETDPDLILQILLAALRWRYNSPKKVDKILQKNLNEVYQIILKGILIR
ncbi:MAG: TetR/AcrR family transcriptional regulator [Saprospiraceae bacterium]|nr:TetR/AcrR family transcriptional regulator [Saprospiraceae bacterium]MBK7738032.1 TetR/AcrR family transcriptional regulator [Saprospiraceae bacterium]MBK7913389.1 TetR/AcrR family transcriptional regulator [Saprospiraceae bacterium]